MGIIIAAGALFTAVYNVLYRYNSSNTINLNAATVDKTGQKNFAVWGSVKNCDETTTLNFDPGTYIMFFTGQDGGNVNYAADSNHAYYGRGAQCIAFYKADGGTKYGVNNMTVQIGVGGGKGGASDGSSDGSGCTRVETNFALPGEYKGDHVAIAAGSGGLSNLTGDYSIQHLANTYGYDNAFKVVDGTFAGWDYAPFAEKIGGPYFGSPACQTHGGRNPGTNTPTPDTGNGSGGGGGAGYFDGGGGWGWAAGGGSCTPWCYPVYSSDVENRPGRYRFGHSWGWVEMGRIDPTSFPDSGVPCSYGETVTLRVANEPEQTPNNFLRTIIGECSEKVGFESYDCGLRTGWVYSVSEDGKSWQGVGPDGLRSATKQDI